MSVHTITGESFEKTVTDNGIVVLDFWAPWCGPCRTFAPIFEKASEKYDDITFGKVNTDEEQSLAMQFQIRSIPTLMIFRDQILLFNQAGALPGPMLDEVLTKVRELDMNEVRAEIAKMEAEQQQA